MARRLGIIGLTGFALVFVGALLEPLWDAPGSDASAAEVASYIDANRDGFIGSRLLYDLCFGLLAVSGRRRRSRSERSSSSRCATACFPR